MTRTTFTADVTESQAALLPRVLALSEELDDLALNAADGTVFDACENAVISGGRDLQRQLLQEVAACKRWTFFTPVSSLARRRRAYLTRARRQRSKPSRMAARYC